MRLRANNLKKCRRAFLMLDLAMAVIVLSLAVLPLGFTFMKERDALRASYCRASANEIVDGEMEILAAGDWKNFPDGTHPYTVQSRAAAKLPAGHFDLTKTGNHLRLEWKPDKREGIGAVIREVTIQ